MSPRQLRMLADCLETYGFYPDTDRKRWADDLRGMAKSMERERMDHLGATLQDIAEMDFLKHPEFR